MPPSPGRSPQSRSRRARSAAERAVFFRRRLAVFAGAVLAIAVIAFVVIALVGLPMAGQPAAGTGSPERDSTTGSTARPTAGATPGASPAPSSSPDGETGTPGSEASASATAFDKKAHSIDDPTSIWVVANKRRALKPEDYVPPDLTYPDVPNINGQPMRKVVAGAIEKMFAAAADDDVHLTVQSAYRSYDTQVSVYNGWVAQLGQKAADLTSSRPGHSEHQTGLAVDVSGDPPKCSLEPCFGDTVYGKWLAENSWKYGLIVRYPEGKTAITGYEYEPYHMRYVGLALATELHKTGIETLEEFFDLPAAPDYG